MIGPIITSILTQDPDILSVAPNIANNLFPVSGDIDRPENVLPAIYYIVRLNPQYNKNGLGNQEWTLTLLTFCDNYAAAWDLAMKIKAAFEKKYRQTVEGSTLRKVLCMSIEDDYEFNIDSFGQTIIFEITT